MAKAPRNPFALIASQAGPAGTRQARAQARPREGVTKAVTPQPDPAAASAKAPRRANGAKERIARAIDALGQFAPRRAVAGIEATLVPGAALVVVPWPPAGLNPNARHGHPAQKARLVKAYRETCWALALEWAGCNLARRLPAEGAVRVHLDFFPPSSAARDDDNLEGAFKAGRDGIAQAIRVDDARWQVTRRLRMEVRAKCGGCVVVTIEPEREAHLAALGMGQ